MNYHNITYPDMNNGSGLRVILWLSGCEHKCKGCQNPQTWDVNSGIPFDEKAKEELFRELDKDYISGLTLTGGDPLHPSNLDGVLDIVTEFNKRYRTTQDIVQNKDNNHNILNENSHEIRLLLPEKTIWLYTGYEIKLSNLTYVDASDDYTIKKQYLFCATQSSKNAVLNIKRQNILNSVDVVVDGRYIDSQRNITAKWKGSDNQRVIDIKKSLREGRLTLWCE